MLHTCGECQKFEQCCAESNKILGLKTVTEDVIKAIRTCPSCPTFIQGAKNEEMEIHPAKRR